MPQMPPLGLVRQSMNESFVAALGLRAFLFALTLENATRSKSCLICYASTSALGKAKDQACADAMTGKPRKSPTCCNQSHRCPGAPSHLTGRDPRVRVDGSEDAAIKTPAQMNGAVPQALLF